MIFFFPQLKRDGTKKSEERKTREKEPRGENGGERKRRD